MKNFFIGVSVGFVLWYALVLTAVYFNRNERYNNEKNR